MSTDDKTPVVGGLKTQIAYQLFKYGPSWVLVFVLIGGIAYELHRFVAYVGPTTAEYVAASRRIDEQNAKNVALLTAAQSDITKQHESMLISLTALQVALENRHLEHAEQSKVIKQLLNLILEATNMMSVVPGQREAQLELLKEIKTAIEDLRVTILQTNGQDDGNHPEP